MEPRILQMVEYSTKELTDEDIHLIRDGIPKSIEDDFGTYSVCHGMPRSVEDDFGFFICTQPKYEKDLWNRLSPKFKTIIIHARLNAYDWIRFDDDAQRL